MLQMNVSTNFFVSLENVEVNTPPKIHGHTQIAESLVVHRNS